MQLENPLIMMSKGVRKTIKSCWELSFVNFNRTRYLRPLDDKLYKVITSVSGLWRQPLSAAVLSFAPNIRCLYLLCHRKAVVTVHNKIWLELNNSGNAFTLRFSTPLCWLDEKLFKFLWSRYPFFCHNPHDFYRQSNSCFFVKHTNAYFANNLNLVSRTKLFATCQRATEKNGSIIQYRFSIKMLKLLWKCGMKIIRVEKKGTKMKSASSNVIQHIKRCKNHAHV